MTQYLFVIACLAEKIFKYTETTVIIIIIIRILVTTAVEFEQLHSQIDTHHMQRGIVSEQL